MSDRLHKNLTGQYGFEVDADRLATLSNLGLPVATDGRLLDLTNANGEVDQKTFRLESTDGEFLLSAVSDDGETVVPGLGVGPEGAATAPVSFSSPAVTATTATVVGTMVLGTKVQLATSSHVAGITTMSSTSATVTDATVAATDVILLTPQFAVAGRLYVTISAGTSFTIHSTSSESGAVGWVKISRV